MKRLLKYIGSVLIFVFLTVISQIGGIIYFISILISTKTKSKIRFKGTIIFLVLYFIAALILIPIVAPIWGREKVIKTKNLKPACMMTLILNRNYVTKKMNLFLHNTSNDLEKINSNIEIRYLDACFPFFDKFPLFPHLSHNDGRKIDFSLIYQNEQGQIINKSKVNEWIWCF